jgi:single-stranded-DNA-specific exonuclease
MANRQHLVVDQLAYGDHGLAEAVETIYEAIQSGKRIALYADYDVDGTMSCVSWIWFLEAIGHKNFVHYIPCRFKEGYGLNLEAMRKLVDEHGAEVIITMDTGITANAEAAYCKSRGVKFICTDHHQVQPEKMPDCVIVNPKLHPDPLYRELCGCGITFVLLRRLGEKLGAPSGIWTDLLGLTGMATICDVVPLNGVNHRLAKMGVAALARSQRPVLKRLMEACRMLGGDSLDEKDVGFRLGPRINAVGRLEHADLVVKAFVGDDPEPLIAFMGECNEKRKRIQRTIVDEARALARTAGGASALVLGGDWHPGVVGIAASKIAEEFWRPVWLYQRGPEVCKGSARSIAGVDVTQAMVAVAKEFGCFEKFGGHAAAGGFTFKTSRETEVRERLQEAVDRLRAEKPALWESRIAYDCELAPGLAGLPLADVLDDLKPFGHGFEEPRFLLDAEIASVRFYNDKTTGEPRHTAVQIRARGGAGAAPQKLMFFHEVHADLANAKRARFVVSAGRESFRGVTSLALYGHDYDLGPGTPG